MSHRLADLAWTEVGDLELVVPLGALEQHGPHLPLGTDTAIATAFADALAASLEGMVVAPPLAYGASGEHQHFPGTISIGTQATAHALTELLRSARHRFAGVVLLCAHGGNADALSQVAALAAEEGDELLVTWPKLRGADLHAGNAETSLMAFLHPAAVRWGSVAPGNLAAPEELTTAMAEGGVAAVSPSGVLGDPSEANAERGEALLAEGTAALVADVVQWRVKRGSR